MALFRVVFLQVLAIVINADQVIRITPASPAVGFVEDSSVNFTCRSLKNVTWTVPRSGYEFDPSLLDVKDNLANRSSIYNHVEGDYYASVLMIRHLRRSDSGRYFCHPPGVDRIADHPSLHLFVSWKDVVGVDPNPVRSVHYVAGKSSSFVVPCFNHFPSNYFSSVELALQKRKSQHSANDSWQTIDLAGKTYLTWSYADYKGILMKSPRPGEYRCGVVRFNGTCTSTKWSSYSFFVVEELSDKDVVIDGQDQRPHIWPSADPFLIYPAGSSFSLMCKTGALAAHQWNVNWRLPSSYDKDDYEHAKVKSLGQRVLVTLAKGSQGKQASSGSDYSVLTVSNASYLDTGYYTCHRADNETINTRQYVFVSDWQSWVAAPRHRYVDYEKTDVVLGCRPTHPAVQMSLVKVADDGTSVSVYPPHTIGRQDAQWKFDLVEGFKLRKASWGAEGTYQCVGRKYYQEGPSRHRSASVTQEVYLGIRGIELVRVSRSDENRSFEEGDHVKLLCRRKGVIDSDQQPEIKWTWASAVNDSVTQRFDENETSWLPGSQVHFERHSGFELSYVEWDNVTANASGNYQCTHPLAGSSAVYKLEVSSGGCRLSCVGLFSSPGRIALFAALLLVNFLRLS